MTIEFQAGDALLHVVNTVLRGDIWSDAVYSKFAPADVMQKYSVWVVCRVTSDVPSNQRGDRDNRTLELRVQAVSEGSSRLTERGASRIYDLLHLSGAQNRRSMSIGVHHEWNILSVVAERAIRLVPNKDAGTRFFENGYVFNVLMEAKDEYI